MEEAYPSWGKTPRLETLSMTITEKIDGTNALIEVLQVGESAADTVGEGAVMVGEYWIRAGSRNHWLTIAQDYYGFCSFVHAHAASLVQLGRGRHYGEWWGRGIGRNYAQTERHFSLFNTFRPAATLPSCVSQVPCLYKGPVDMCAVDEFIYQLEQHGSIAAPGFKPAEGVIIWFGKEKYKCTFEGPKYAHVERTSPYQPSRRERLRHYPDLDRRGPCRSVRVLVSAPRQE